MEMAKSGLERVGDLAHAAKALYDIIKAALKGGWQAAALAALKHYWPQILAIALILTLLPAIIVCCLPAVFLGFGGSREQEKAEAYQSCYDRYEEYRAEQLEEIRNAQAAVCSIEYLNDPLDKSWLIALDSVNNENDINQMDEEKLKKLIRKTYHYEIVDAQPVADEYENPWEDTTHRSSYPEDDAETPTNPVKVMQVTTLAPEEIMRELGFDSEHINWATLIHETLADNENGG